MEDQIVPRNDGFAYWSDVPTDTLEQINATLAGAGSDVRIDLSKPGWRDGEVYSDVIREALDGVADRLIAKLGEALTNLGLSMN